MYFLLKSKNYHSLHITFVDLVVHILSKGMTNSPQSLNKLLHMQNNPPPPPIILLLYAGIFVFCSINPIQLDYNSYVDLEQHWFC